MVFLVFMVFHDFHILFDAMHGKKLHQKGCGQIRIPIPS